MTEKTFNELADEAFDIPIGAGQMHGEGVLSGYQLRLLKKAQDAALSYRQKYMTTEEKLNLDPTQMTHDQLIELNASFIGVMVAAAEEIHEHWEAHCDEEGYGPANLMRRLEKGINAFYPGYDPGSFTRLERKVEALEAELALYKPKGGLPSSHSTHQCQAPDGWALPALPEPPKVDRVAYSFNACDVNYDVARVKALREFEDKNPGTVNPLIFTLQGGAS